MCLKLSKHLKVMYSPALIQNFSVIFPSHTALGVDSTDYKLHNSRIWVHSRWRWNGPRQTNTQEIATNHSSLIHVVRWCVLTYINMCWYATHNYCTVHKQVYLQSVCCFSEKLNYIGKHLLLTLYTHVHTCSLMIGYEVCREHCHVHGETLNRSFTFGCPSSFTMYSRTRSVELAVILDRP